MNPDDEFNKHVISETYSSAPKTDFQKKNKVAMDNIWRKEQTFDTFHLPDNRKSNSQINIQNLHIAQQQANGLMNRKMDFFNSLLEQTNKNIEQISSKLTGIQ